MSWSVYSWINKRQSNPTYKYTKNSYAIKQLLNQFIIRGDKILEAGSSTGHISYMLAKEGYDVSLLDIRSDVIDIAKQNFKNLKAKFYVDDLLSHYGEYDLLWNSGLIQCLDEQQQRIYIEHMAKNAKKVLLIYPDTESHLKVRGGNAEKIPGVDDAIEYGVKKVPLIFGESFSEIYFGSLRAKIDINEAFDMLWIVGINQ